VALKNWKIRKCLPKFQRNWSTSSANLGDGLRRKQIGFQIQKGTHVRGKFNIAAIIDGLRRKDQNHDYQ
jgi:hypothetical protein